MTQDNRPSNVTAFVGPERVVTGTLAQVAAQLYGRPQTGHPLLVFSDETGRVVDMDLHGTGEEVARRYAMPEVAPEPEPDGGTRGRGRPRLGVVAREITLLPRHWEWLAAQSGGASQTLRRLVDEARKADGGRTGTKRAQERTYRFLTAMAGDLPDYEEAIRALFAADLTGLAQHMTDWPADIRHHALGLLADNGTNGGKD